MKFDPMSQNSFGRHETFPLRYGWLTKGFQALQHDPKLFTQEESVVTLGVGKNMVHAIRFWLQACGFIEPHPPEGFQPSRLGWIVLGEEGDPWLEDEVTLWLIHGLIASHTRLATGFYWFFNEWAQPSFTESEALGGLQQFVRQRLQSERGGTPLKSDIATLLRMYTHQERISARHAEDQLDSPLTQLDLITLGRDGRYQSPRRWRDELPEVVLGYLVLQRFEAEPTLNALPIRELLYGGSGWPAPGAIFRLTEESLLHTLERFIQNHCPTELELRDTAGIHQLYRHPSTAVQSYRLLQHHYQKSF